MNALILAASLSTIALGGGDVNTQPVTEPVTPALQRVAFAEFFQQDPLRKTDVTIAGDALNRVRWERTPPAFPGDRPGVLIADYDIRELAGEAERRS